MKMYNIPLDQIVPNPWRDLTLYPIDDNHVTDIAQSINVHDFFQTPKGRRVNGKVQLGCGHTRIAAARKAKLETVPIFIDEIDDDTMLLLMTDENATQAGAHPGAVINEVAAVTRRLIGGLLDTGTIVPVNCGKAFENKTAMEQARSKLQNGKDVHLALGHNVIRRYLGQGNIDRSHRGERQIREAISALKQSGKYDDIVEEAVAKYAQPVEGVEPAKSKAIERKEPRRRILDERCANVFPNEHQFHAFREAVTSPSAQKMIPVDQQFALAKNIMRQAAQDQAKLPGVKKKPKQIGAPYIKMQVQGVVKDALKEQREIDKEEREKYLAEQREERIDANLHSANASLRSLSSALLKMCELADEYPAHPKLTGFSERLKPLRSAIDQLEAKLDPRKRR